MSRVVVFKIEVGEDKRDPCVPLYQTHYVVLATDLKELRQELILLVVSKDRMTHRSLWNEKEKRSQ